VQGVIKARRARARGDDKPLSDEEVALDPDVLDD
jgi:hypothetical protein